MGSRAIVALSVLLISFAVGLAQAQPLLYLVEPPSAYASAAVAPAENTRSHMFVRPSKRAFDRLDTSMFDFMTSVKRFGDGGGSGSGGYVFGGGDDLLSSSGVGNELAPSHPFVMFRQSRPVPLKRAFDRLDSSSFFHHKRSLLRNDSEDSPSATIAQVSEFLNSRHPQVVAATPEEVVPNSTL